MTDVIFQPLNNVLRQFIIHITFLQPVSASKIHLEGVMISSFGSEQTSTFWSQNTLGVEVLVINLFSG